MYKSGFAPAGICYDPVTAAIVLGVGAAAAGGAQAYGANQQAKAAKSAANTQADVAREQMKQTADLQIKSAEEAKSKLKLKQASNTNTLLTSPLTPVEDNVSAKSILGV